MASPTATPTPPAQISERRHADPPALWLGAISASVAIHVIAFGVLGLLAIEGIPGWRFNKSPIPVDVIVVSSTKTRTQTTLKPSSTTAQLRRFNTPVSRTSNQGFNRQTSSVSKPSSSSANSPSNPIQTGKPNQFQNQSPATNPAQNQSPGTPAAPTNPNAPTNNGTQPGGPGPAPSPAPNPVPPVEPSSGPDSSSTEQGGGVGINISGFRRSESQVDIPTQEAKVILNQDQLVVDLYQPVVLEILLLIDRNGKATLQVPPQVVQGSSNIEPTQLAELVIRNSQFVAAQMEGGAVDQEYYLTVSLTPRAK